jgi:hypothetical protein
VEYPFDDVTIKFYNFLLRLQETGLFNHYPEKNPDGGIEINRKIEPECRPRRAQKTGCPVSPKIGPLTFRQLARTFLLLACGQVLAFVAFIFEQGPML